MRHYDFLGGDQREALFDVAPEPFDRTSDVRVLAPALGASLYLPADRPDVAGDLARQAARGVVSAVVCLEDAVADRDLAHAERNAVAQLRAVARAGSPAPLVFVRVRRAEQIAMVVEGLGEDAHVLSGFVLPKFTAATGAVALAAVLDAGAALGRRLLAMPVLESPDLVHAETRVAALRATRALLDPVREHVPAVRVGVTDMAAVYGLRRGREFTVYDVRLLADVLADVVNVFGRADGYVVTGPVWEHFTGEERLFKPQLRETPFADEGQLRADLVARDLDGLLREVALDKANGLLGKTVIHPSHVAAVHALSVVTHEEHADALDVLGTGGGGGVSASRYGNKMNESKPHTEWARRTVARARAFGVARESTTWVDLLAAGLRR